VAFALVQSSVLERVSASSPLAFRGLALSIIAKGPFATGLHLDRRGTNCSTYIVDGKTTIWHPASAFFVNNNERFTNISGNSLG
jgi:hypothetical protein